VKEMSITIYDKLAAQGIFGPGSEELKKYERHLVRYFEREYIRLQEHPVSLDSLDVNTTQGPMMEETEALMERHYDEKPEFFASFLDKEFRAYSMAFYGDTPEEIMNSTATLEEAQRAKFDLIVKRAQISGNERVLNIGCGFGSLETYLLKTFPNLEIVGITPSKVQSEYLIDRMQNMNDPLGKGNFSLITGTFDGTSLEAIGKNKYDLVISVAVFEQIYNMHDVLERIHFLLRPCGKTFHHFITSRFLIPQFINPDQTKIGNYFPGGRVWPHQEFARHTDHFNLENLWFLNGLNYWRTLTCWHERYWANLGNLYGSVFDTAEISHWNEYFSLCKVVFAPLDGFCYGNSHYLFSKSS
jgi:cyclopropane-fatty-acyl-phospholipid synthase